MFGFGKKKDEAPASEAPDDRAAGGGLSSNRTRIALLALVLVAGLGYLAYEYLPGLLDPAPPPMPVQAKPKPKPAPVAVAQTTAVPVPVAAAATEPATKPQAEPAPEPKAKPAPTPEPVAKAEPKPAPTPEPAAKPEPKPVPKPAAKPAPKPEPIAKPASKPAPVVVAAAPAAEPKPAAEPTPAAEPKPAAEPTPAPALVAPAAAVAPAVAPLRGPPPIVLKYNDVMTAVLYSDREAVAQLLDVGRWVDKPDSNGLTPLMAAVLGRDPDMVRLLLERGADPNLQAPGGEVALEMARANGDGASESLLLKAGARY